MKQPWKRLVEVRGPGGLASGLEYHYPCGHSAFVSFAQIEGAHKGLLKYPEVAVCPDCPTGGAE